MKKILFLLMFVLATASSIAQEKYPYYCTINGSYNLAMKIRIELEWGESKDKRYLRDENGKKIEFNNLIDILNYMSKRGWEFVTIAEYDKCISTSLSERWYLLRRRQSKDSASIQTNSNTISRLSTYR